MSCHYPLQLKSKGVFTYYVSNFCAIVNALLSCQPYFQKLKYLKSTSAQNPLPPFFS